MRRQRYSISRTVKLNRWAIDESSQEVDQDESSQEVDQEVKSIDDQNLVIRPLIWERLHSNWKTSIRDWAQMPKEPLDNVTRTEKLDYSYTH